MKTAISLPDNLFKMAEKTAKKMGIPRSQLFARAIEEFINKQSKNSITEKLNRVYGGTIQFEERANGVSFHSFKNSLKNDSW
jgi:metal-responsive CopG/Arc/MetJ family transcriptional regulator